MKPTSILRKLENKMLPTCVSMHGGVDDGIFVDSEHVAADALGLVLLLPTVGEERSNELTSVFDDHFPLLNGAFAEETPTMNARSVHANGLLCTLMTNKTCVMKSARVQ